MKFIDYNDNDINFFKICKLCNNEITKCNVMNNVKQLLTQHLKKCHNITPKEYLLTIIDDFPYCKCGCNESTDVKSFTIKKYKSKHKSRIMYNKNFNNNLIINHRHGLTISDLKTAFDLYKNPEFTLSKIAKQYGIDARTLKNSFLTYKICTADEFKDLAEKHKYSLKYELKENCHKYKIDDDILEKIYIELLELFKHKKTTTLTKIISEYNLKCSIHVLYTRLSETFGTDNIDRCLTKGNSSIPETNFYFVLCYFFGKNNIKRQVTIERKIYDFLLFNKLLIEFDGEYWHSTAEAIINDKTKNEIALKNGYQIMRISDKKAKQIDNIIEIANKIKDIKNETCKN